MLRPLPLFGTGSLPPAAAPKPNSRPISQQIAPNKQSIAARNAPPLRAPRRESRPPGTAQIGERRRGLRTHDTPRLRGPAHPAVDTKELAPGEIVGNQPARLADNGLGRPQAVVEVGRLERIQIRCHQLARPARSTSFIARDGVDHAVADPVDDFWQKVPPPAPVFGKLPGALERSRDWSNRLHAAPERRPGETYRARWRRNSRRTPA